MLTFEFTLTFTTEASCLEDALDAFLEYASNPLHLEQAECEVSDGGGDE